jgi:hypothetical protein
LKTLDGRSIEVDTGFLFVHFDSKEAAERAVLETLPRRDAEEEMSLAMKPLSFSRPSSVVREAR